MRIEDDGGADLQAGHQAIGLRIGEEQPRRGEQAIARGDAQALMRDALDFAREPVLVHDGFGFARSARRVAPESRRVVVDPVRLDRHRSRHGAPPFVHQDDALTPGRRRVVGVRGEDHVEAGLVQDVMPFGRRNLRIDRDGDTAGPDRAEKRNHPVDAVRQLDGHAVARPQAARLPDPGRAGDALAQFGVSQLLVAANERDVRRFDRRQQQCRRVDRLFQCGGVASGAGGVHQRIAEQARLARAPAVVFGCEQRGMVPLLGTEFEVQALLGRIRRRRCGARRKESGRFVLERDRHAEQVGGILRPVLHAAVDRGQLDAEVGGWMGRLDVVAP